MREPGRTGAACALAGSDAGFRETGFASGRVRYAFVAPARAVVESRELVALRSALVAHQYQPQLPALLQIPASATVRPCVIANHLRSKPFAL